MSTHGPAVDPGSPEASAADRGPDPEAPEEHLGDLFGEGANALLYILAMLVFLAVIVLVTWLLVPGPLQS